MRLMDVVLSFPSLILAIAIVTVLGPGLINAHARDRHRVHPDLCAGHARLRAVRARDGLRDRVAGARRVVRRDPAPADPAQRADPAHRRRARSASAARSSRSRRSRSSASAPSRRPPSGASMIAQRPQPVLLGAAPDLLPGPRHHADACSASTSRRRPARRPRPAAQPMTDDRRDRSDDDPGDPGRADPRPSLEDDRHRGARARLASGDRGTSAASGRSSRSRACRRRSTPATASSGPSTASTSTSTAARSWASSASPAAARA